MPVVVVEEEAEAERADEEGDAGVAVALARDAGVGTVVPMHYELMEGNLGDVEECVRLAPKLYPGGRVAVLDRMAETPLASLVVG